MFNLDPDVTDFLYNLGVRVLKMMAVSFTIFYSAGLICERLEKRGRKR